MALNPVVLGTAMADALQVTDAASRAAYQTLAAVIVAHIQANATVTSNGLATAVQPGTGTAPTTSTGTIA